MRVGCVAIYASQRLRHQASGARRREGCEPAGARHALAGLDSRQPDAAGGMPSTPTRVTQMPDDELRELEAKRRKALWMLANISPGDSKAFDALSILDDLDLQERKDSPHADKVLELNQLRDFVTVQYHHSGIDIILEQTIPQPWRERFNQASIGSTRLLDGPYAADWYKFLACWESEMQHLEAHRAARSKPKLD